MLGHTAKFAGGCATEKAQGAMFEACGDAIGDRQEEDQANGKEALRQLLEAQDGVDDDAAPAEREAGARPDNISAQRGGKG